MMILVISMACREGIAYPSQVVGITQLIILTAAATPQ